MDISIEADGSYSADLAGQFDLQVGDRVNVWYRDPNGNQLGTELRTLSIDVNYGHDWVYAATEPSASVDVTVIGKAVQEGQADSSGDFHTDWARRPGFPARRTSSQAMWWLSRPPGSSREWTPWGRSAARWTWRKTPSPAASLLRGSSEPLRVRCEVWVENGPPAIETTVDPDGGSYVCDFGDVGWDLLPGQDVAVRYFEPDGDSVINVLSTPWMRVNYADDWVGGNYPAGHTFWITVTDTSGALKATAEISTASGGGWGGDGFETQPEHWSPDRPDLASGDWVTSGPTTVTPTPSTAATSPVHWIWRRTRCPAPSRRAGSPETLRVRCEVWYVANSPNGDRN